MRTAALSLVLLCLFASPVFAAPAAHWLWIGDAKEAAYLRQTFHMKPGLVKAILLGAATGKMEVFINGKPAGVIESADKPTALDITALVQLGNNAVAVKAAPAGAGLPSAVTMMIEFTRDGGQSQWLVTDDTWAASSKESKGWDAADFSIASWNAATSLGKVGAADAKVKANPFDPTKVVDAYNSWRLAMMNGRATDPATITAPPGFTVELIRSAQIGEDSWIALAFDPKGRITIAKERKGLMRFTLSESAGKLTVASIDSINDSLLECRGLLYAHGALYVNANNSKTLVRLRDSNPNDNIDFLDESRLLLRTEGGVGHGRNHLTLGPDGAIYITHGNDVRLPGKLAPTSPYKGYDADQLVPCEWDAQLDSGGEQVPGGHILKMDKEGASFELIAAGLRNPMGVAFDKDGEMFTYDADMELDLGTPWYRPTRINHIVSGGEYGWRRGTGKWPAYYPDSMGSVCDIGLGSPTAVRFGTGSKFPRKYQNAMFIGDWAYGRILAVHLSPRGATYTGGFEPFLAGRPLNVTDFTFGPDGALYFVTGGRQTQSGLYRVRYTGPAEPPAPPLTEAEDQALFAAEMARFKRFELESAHHRLAGDEAKAAVKNALANLGNADPSMRFAARVALEHQDPALWSDAAIAAADPTARIIGCIALARVGELKQQAAILRRLGELDFAKLTAEQQLMLLRAYALAFVRMGRPDADVMVNLAAKFDVFYPSRFREVNHELCELLVFLGSTTVRDRTFRLIEAADQPEDLIQYLYTIRKVRVGWTREMIVAFLRGLNKASHLHPGRYYASSIRAMRLEIASALSNEMKQQLAEFLAEPAAPATYLAAEKAVFVRDWKLEDLLPALDGASRGRSFEKGREAFATAQCAACHRFGTDVPGTEVGPDLTAAASRFSRRDLLESIIHPSKAIDDKFKQTQITLTDGTVHSGQVSAADGDRVILFPNLLASGAVTIAKKDIASQKVSEVSPMPTGLLSVLSREQILDLLAYIESGGKPEHGAFAK